MNILMDLHTHTIVSGHAYSTLKENIEEAARKGLKVLGTSEHAKNMPGTCQPIYFLNMKVIKDEIDGVRILKGIEANIIDYQGTLDIDIETKHLDYVIASLHHPCIKEGSYEENTNAILGAMNHPLVKIIGHPDDGKYPMDIDKIAKTAKEKNIALELNNSSLYTRSSRVNGRENAKKMLEACMKYNTYVMVGSDSHIYYDIGNFEEAIKLLEEVNFPEELVLNASMKGLEFITGEK